MNTKQVITLNNGKVMPVIGLGTYAVSENTIYYEIRVQLW